MSGFFVTGTGTDIGKTVVTALLTDFLSDQHDTFFPYKPIQTGAEELEGKVLAPDPELYKLVLTASEMNKHYTYLLKTPSSPHLAASKENITFDFSLIKRDIREVETKYGGIIVEGAGGLYVPITHDGYCMIDLMKDLSFPVILVGEAGLGTINHTVLSIKALQMSNIPIVGVILNGTGKEDPVLEADNMKMIEQLTNVPIIGTVPFVDHMEEKLTDRNYRATYTANWKRHILEKHFNREEY